MSSPASWSFLPQVWSDILCQGTRRGFCETGLLSPPPGPSSEPSPWAPGEDLLVVISQSHVHAPLLRPTSVGLCFSCLEMMRWDRRRQGDHAGSWEQALVLLVRLPDLLLPPGAWETLSRGGGWAKACSGPGLGCEGRGGRL